MSQGELLPLIRDCIVPCHCLIITTSIIIISGNSIHLRRDIAAIDPLTLEAAHAVVNAPRRVLAIAPTIA